MLKRPVTQADFDRLEDARLAADRLYNEALTALDRAIPPAPSAGPPEPAPYDAREVTPLNESWRVTPEAPVSRGMRGGLARAVWRVVSPWLARQEAFNARLVAHLNGNVRHEQEVATAVASALRAAGEQATALATFHSRLIVFLQQVTPYVDTKDRSVLGHLALVDEQAINAVADELLRRSEAMQAREARFAADVHALKAAHEEMRSTFATLYQATFTVKRELERLVGSVRDPGSVRLPPSQDAPASAPGFGGFDVASGGVESADRRSLGGGGQADRDPRPLDSWKYVGFEDHFRGAREDIRRRLAEYVPLFTGAADVLDVGCGRGEFLDLLREAGISARGLDPNHEMVEVCRARGLVAEETDVLRFLRAAPDGSLGGLFAAQVIEHLEPEYLMRTLEAAYHALRPGSRLVLETINPACWTAFFESYIRDLTHVRAIHPETLQYLLTASGFQRIEIQYRSPLPERERLQTVTVPRDASPSIREAFETLNENAGRLNERLFSHMDYAAVAVRL